MTEVDIEAKRTARRAAMPITTAFMEQFAEFSPRLIYASENGVTYGHKPEVAAAFEIPTGYGMPTDAAKGKKC